MNPDPLAQLRPLHLPDQIGWWPPAPGWWVLAFLAAALLLAATWLLRRWLAGNGYRRAARRELLAAYRRSCNAAPAAVFAIDASRILRRAALARYPRREVASLCADRWLAFLDRSSGTRLFSEGPGRALADAPYDPNSMPDNAALHEACQQWLRRHR